LLISGLMTSDQDPHSLHARSTARARAREDSPDDIRKPLKEARHDVVPSRNIACQDHRLDRRETVEEIDILGVIRHIGDPL
jgi:hypothetical protein